MKKTCLLVLPLALTLAGCNGDEKKADELYRRAEASFAGGNYSQAKLQIDSIRSLYPKVFGARKAGIKLMQQVDLAEQRKTLAYLDSMMAVKKAALDSIVGNFVLEKDTAYQEVGNYFYPTQIVEKNIGRTFLRGQVSERGEMSITSIYCAGGNIHHTAVKVSVGDNFAQTPLSSDSYETTDLGRPVEKADYKLGNDGGVIAFIAANRELPRFIVNEVLARPKQTGIMKDNALRIVNKLLDNLQQDIDEHAAKGLCRRVNAQMLLIDIVSLNVFPFMAAPIVKSAIGSYYDNYDSFLELRKKENVETILKKLKLD